MWAVARDGSAWYRGGVAPFTPTGKEQSLRSGRKVVHQPKTSMFNSGPSSTQVYKIEDVKAYFMYLVLGVVHHNCPNAMRCMILSCIMSIPTLSEL